MCLNMSELLSKYPTLSGLGYAVFKQSLPRPAPPRAVASLVSEKVSDQCWSWSVVCRDPQFSYRYFRIAATVPKYIED